MRPDSMEKTDQTVYILNGIKLLPHYTLPYYVTPGHTRITPLKMWTAKDLLEAGAVQSSAHLWPRHTLASEGQTNESVA
jgi:hypothetical protein